MISVLLPTRKRPAGVNRTLGGLLELAARPLEFEVILRVDEDDPTDYGAIDHLDYLDRYGQARVLRGPRHGYKNMHIYYGELARAATKPWCLIWNDDMFMVTPRWDDVLLSNGFDKMHVQFLKRDIYGAQAPGEPAYNIDCACPFFPKRYFEVTGRLSANAHVDSWLDYVSEILKIKTFRHDVVYHHDRLEDETAREVIAGYDWQAFHTPENAGERSADIRKLADFLLDNPAYQLGTPAAYEALMAFKMTRHPR